ncbi:exopolysaccharide biosynthesis protein [Pokkaliibacter sp. CJK22405]|uniref:exopolysaccharide biosynthesis protein n=1 Tax=Pokkaliibacter sp. CJK22405 TaxID=3384615 RepID=UPI0039849087
MIKAPQPLSVGMSQSLPPDNSHRTSTLLMVLASTHSAPRLSLGELMEALGARSFGMLLFIFTLPNLLPLGIPGLSTLTGLPLLIVTWQMLLGREQPWLPDWIAKRSLATRDFHRLCRKICPWISKIEKLTRPRPPFARGKPGQCLLALLAMVQVVILILPIPFGNLLPAWTLAVLALGMIEKDGVLLLLSVVLSVLSTTFVATLVVAMVKSAIALMGQWLS